jgi:hypothetical protein
MLWCLVLLLHRYTFPAFGRVMAVYVVPTSMGYSRMITRFVKNKRNHPARPGLMGIVLKVRRAAAPAALRAAVFRHFADDLSTF